MLNDLKVGVSEIQSEIRRGLQNRKLKIAAQWIVAAGFLAAGSMAAADCACFCVNGELRTMCTTVEEAQNDPVLCPVYAAASCPLESVSTSGEAYEAPVDGATNCRDVRVWDSVSGAYIDVKACDVDG